MITVAQVCKAFGPVVALERVSFEIGAGERIAFVGANGSGKTTLLRAILGLVRVEGRVTVAGVDVARSPELALRSLAYIPQIAPPIEAPVSEVIRAHAALRGRPVSATYDRAARLGLALEASRAKRFRDLSGGMKQKLLAGMALATEAPILVCDEPTANLDGEARVSFFEQLAERPEGAILVLCSHRVEEVRALVDRVIELGDGRVVRDGPAADVGDERCESQREPARPQTVRSGGPVTRRSLLRALVAPAVLAACTTADGPVEPVWRKQACAHCAMVLSDRRFGAQVLSSAGDRFFFDDPGCMVVFLEERGLGNAQAWVDDAGAGRWVDARGARYAGGAMTPMDFGYEPKSAGEFSWSEMRARVLVKEKEAR